MNSMSKLFIHLKLAKDSYLKLPSLTQNSSGSIITLWMKFSLICNGTTFEQQAVYFQIIVRCLYSSKNGKFVSSVITLYN